jgi:phospholipid-transporting ATPase
MKDSESKVSYQHINKKNYEYYINNVELNKKSYNHKSNTIDTKKYGLFTFLPKSLLFQFMRLANVYFLIIAIIQSIPEISPLSPLTAAAPICFVLLVSIIREGIEDYERYKYDKEQNEEVVTVFRDSNWVETSSGNLELGEIVVINEDRTFPADIVLLDSNIKEGIAYIETGTLDGERTLKSKIAHKNTAGYFNNGGTWKNSFVIDGFCSCDPPNADLARFIGSLQLNINNNTINEKLNINIGLENKQMLPKGAILRNTQWILGYITYTGHSTKLLLNSKKGRYKFSKVEFTLSKLLVFILFLQVIFCIICASMNLVYYDTVVSVSNYLPTSQFNPTIDAVLTYFTYTLLLNTMIPISLIISLEIVKIVQGYFIGLDCGMYSDVRNKYIYIKIGFVKQDLFL